MKKTVIIHVERTNLNARAIYQSPVPQYVYHGVTVVIMKMIVMMAQMN